MSPHAVETRALVKRFGATTAVDGVDLVVPHGAVYGLLGPNGAGKTTIVRMLTTLLRPDAGVALVDGIDVCRDPDGVRRRIGLTGQYAAVEERLTGRENMQYVGRLFHMPKPRSVSRAATSCSNGSTWSTPPTGSSRPTRVACGGGSTSR